MDDCHCQLHHTSSLQLAPPLGFRGPQQRVQEPGAYGGPAFCNDGGVITEALFVIEYGSQQRQANEFVRIISAPKKGKRLLQRLLRVEFNVGWLRDVLLRLPGHERQEESAACWP